MIHYNGLLCCNTSSRVNPSVDPDDLVLQYPSVMRFHLQRGMIHELPNATV